MSKMLKFIISKKCINLLLCFCMLGVFIGVFSHSTVCLAESDINALIGRGNDATEYEYWVEIGGVGMTDLQIDTPWGEHFLASDHLPQGWQGEFFEYDNPSLGLEFEAYTENGNLFMEICWIWENPGSKWDALDTQETTLTVFYSQGSWTGSVDFSSSPIPTQVPVITYPSQGALDVELFPTFTWEQWINPDTNKNPGIWWELCKSKTDEDIYDGEHAPADTTSWTPVTELPSGTLYEFDIDFHYSPTVQVNGVDVEVCSYREANTELEFTTAASDVSLTQECVTLGSDFGLTIPCAEYSGLHFELTLNHYVNLSDPFGFYWELGNVNAVTCDCGGGCTTIDNALKITIPCFEYDGIQFDIVVILEHFTNPQNPLSFYWKLSSVQ